MENLLEIIKKTENSGQAVGHFNIAETAALNAIVRVVQETGLPAIIGTSEGEASFLGYSRVAALIRSLREKEGLPIYSNADHHHSLEKIKEAIEAGYDAVIFDGSSLPIEENIARTKEVVDYVRQNAPGVLVEGEVGYIGSGSEVRSELPEGAALSSEEFTSPEDAARFVEETGVDFFSPAVGNLHGMFKNAPNPALDIQRIRDIKAAIKKPMVLHGGSGITDEDFKAAIEAGINMVHISTEMRVAWRNGLEARLKEKPNEVAPYKLLDQSVDEIAGVVERRMKLFANK